MINLVIDYLSEKGVKVEDRAFIDTTPRLKCKEQSFKGFRIKCTGNPNSKTRYEALIFKDKLKYKHFLSNIYNDLTSGKWDSISHWANLNKNFFSISKREKLEQGMIGELLFAYFTKNTLKVLDSLNEYSIDVNNKSQIEIKSSFTNHFYVRYPQWEEVKKFAFIKIKRLEKDGKNILDLIKIIEKKIANKHTILEEIKNEFSINKPRYQFQIEKTKIKIMNKTTLRLHNWDTKHFTSVSANLIIDFKKYTKPISK